MPPGGPPITTADRKRVAELHAQGLTRNAIAREIKRSPSTVSKIAADLGLNFDRSLTAAATKAKQADAKSRRADRASSALDTAADLEHRSLAADNARDTRDYAVAYGIFIDRHLRLIEADREDGHAEAASLLGAMLGGLQAKHGTEPAPDA